MYSNQLHRILMRLELLRNKQLLASPDVVTNIAFHSNSRKITKIQKQNLVVYSVIHILSNESHVVTEHHHLIANGKGTHQIVDIPPCEQAYIYN